MGRFAMPLLFSVLTCALAAIAVESWRAGRWPIGISAAVLTAWMGSFAWAAVKRL